MAVEYIVIGPGVLTIGSTTSLMTFQSQTTSCKLTPSVDKGDPINVLSGEQVSGDRTESFTLDGSFLQDFGSTTSKVEWLFTHRGEDQPFVFTPNSAKGKSVTGTLTVEAVDIGGDVTTKPTSDFSFNIIGAPVIGAAPSGFAALSTTDGEDEFREALADADASL